jgi:ribonuclease HIII
MVSPKRFLFKSNQDSIFFKKEGFGILSLCCKIWISLILTYFFPNIEFLMNNGKSKIRPPVFSTRLDLKLAQKLENDLRNQGFTLSRPPYTLFQAKKKNISCTLYESGSLTVQGKDKDEFLEFYLEPEILKTFSYTHSHVELNLEPRIGVDEAGKGDFFGPLCVTAFYAGSDEIQKLHEMGVKDSKRMSDDSVIRLAAKLRKSFLHVTVRISPQKYNELYQSFHNLNRLLGWGHATAIVELARKTSCSKIVIDQFADESVVENAVKRKGMELHLEQRTKAESDPVVAAASICARASFLEGLKNLSEETGIELPKGASARVIVIGKKIVRQFGVDMLKRLTKVHFKTYAEVLQE